jgi:uncharacterized membrane protein YphA (DoxX/SURF4 family)
LATLLAALTTLTGFLSLLTGLILLPLLAALTRFVALLVLLVLIILVHRVSFRLERGKQPTIQSFVPLAASGNNANERRAFR